MPVVAKTLKQEMVTEFGAANVTYAQGCKVLPDENQRTIYFENGEPMADPRKPLLDLDMRLGEASGAALAIPLLRAALACHTGMATFAEAGVADKPR